MDRNAVTELAELITGKVLMQVPLRRHTSLKVGGPADMMVYPANLEELRTIIRFSDAHSLPYCIMGAGTNLLVRDGGFRGVVVKLSRGFRKITLLRTEADSCFIQAEAGASLRKLLAFCLERKLAGLEFISGIPGSLGGAWAMNAGAHGKAMADITEAITLLTPQGAVEEKKSPDVAFSYRKLDLPPGTVIIGGVLRAMRGRRDELERTIQDLNRRRWETQPLHLPSAGSVFKNPVGHSAGKLLEQAGLKGVRVGGAQVSEQHANFIVNLGGATAREILTLMETMQKRVYEKTGIELEPELRIIGEDGETNAG